MVASKTNGEAPIRGLAAHSKGLELKPFEYVPEPLGQNDIEISPEWNGLCHSDIHVVSEHWGPQPFPKIPGHEIVGKVTKLGSGVKHLKEGQLVGVGWHKSACLECDQCVAGDTNLCTVALVPTIYGDTQGGFAERFRCNGALAVEVPDGMDPKQVAPLMCAGITVWAPVSNHITKPGMKVGVAGLGGLGHLALQFARAVGAEVFAISGSKSKEKEARELGAKQFMSLDEVPDASLDVILNCIPSGADHAKMMTKLAFNGKLILLGSFAEQLEGIPIAPLILGQHSIVGSTTGGRRLFREMLRIVALHNIKTLVEVYPLKDANKAFQHLLKGSPKYRIVLETGDFFTK